MFVANPYGNAGKLDLTTVKVRGETSVYTQNRAGYGSQITWVQANKLHVFKLATNQIAMMYMSDLQSTTRHGLMKIKIDLAGDIVVDSYFSTDITGSFTSGFG